MYVKQGKFKIGVVPTDRLGRLLRKSIFGVSDPLCLSFSSALLFIIILCSLVYHPVNWDDHMQWTLIAQSHGCFFKENNCFAISTFILYFKRACMAVSAGSNTTNFVRF
jgi:hypothetical protein